MVHPSLDFPDHRSSTDQYYVKLPLYLTQVIAQVRYTGTPPYSGGGGSPKARVMVTINVVGVGD